MSSLIVSRRVGETICIGDDVEVTIMAINGQQARCRITAPPSVTIDRHEIRDRRLQGIPIVDKNDPQGNI